MPPRRPSPRRLRSLCAEVHPDDGADPRFDARGGGSPSKGKQKARQLCRQVAEVLDSLLSGDSGDDVLSGLAVVAVEPAPDGSRLLATLGFRPSAVATDPAEALDRLDRASGWLRSEVAAAITRKRAPLIAYRLVAIGSGTETPC